MDNITHFHEVAQLYRGFEDISAFDFSYSNMWTVCDVLQYSTRTILVNLVQKISLLVYICPQKHGWNAQPVARSNPRPMQTRSKTGEPNEQHGQIVYLSRLGVKVNFWSPRMCIHTAPNVEILIPLDIMQLSSSTYRWTWINCSSITSVEKEEEQRRRVLLVAGKEPREKG